MSEERVRREPSANGQITSGRRSVFRIILDEVIIKNIQEIKNNFVEDIIIPNTVDWLYDVFSSLVNDMFKSPGAGRSTLPGQYGRSSYTSYSKAGKSSRDRRRDREPMNDRALTYKDISFESRKEAEKVITDLRMDLMDYGTVTIADLCYFSGVEETWADVKYGWTNLDRAKCYRARDGRYYLDLPEPKPIEQD